MASNFEPQKYAILVKSTKIGTHENKSTDSMLHVHFPQFSKKNPPKGRFTHIVHLCLCCFFYGKIQLQIRTLTVLCY